MNGRELVYIASPLRGDVEKNIASAMRYCERAIEEGYIPIAPHAMYRGMFNDEVPLQRAAALEIGLQLLERCTRVWVCGDVISEGMRGEIDLASRRGIPVDRKPEAYFQSGNRAEEPRTFEALRTATMEALEEGCKTSDGLRGLLREKAKFEPYSLQNAVAISKQSPSATKLLTYHQWREAGFRVVDTRHSVKVWVPVVRTTFLRGGVETDLRAADADERAATGRGEIKVRQKTTYRMDALYDISQTNCQPAEYLRLERAGVVPGNPLSSLNDLEKYACLRAAAEASGLAVEESADPSAVIFPCCEEGKLVISSRTHISQRLADLCRVYADALVEMSSTQTPEIRDFESYTLAFLLQSKMGLPDQGERPIIPERAAEIFRTEPALFESCMDRVQRMANHIDVDLRAALQEQGLDEGRSKRQKKNSVPISGPGPKILC